MIEINRNNELEIQKIWPKHSMRFFEQPQWLINVALHLFKGDDSYIFHDCNTVLPLVKKGGNWQGLDHPHAYISALVIGDVKNAPNLPFKYGSIKFHRTIADNQPFNSNAVSSKFGPSFYFDTSTLTDWQGELSSSFKKNLRRLRKRADKLDILTCKVISDRSALKSSLDNFLQLEASGWKGENSSSILDSENIKDFYQSLVESELNVVIHELFVGEKIVASQFCIRDEYAINLLKIAYDEEFQAISPGSLLLEDILCHYTNEEGCNRLSLVTGPDWAKRWKPKAETLYSHQLFESSLNSNYLKLKAKRLAKTALRGVGV